MLPAPVLLMLEREAAELAALHLGLPRVAVPLTGRLKSWPQSTNIRQSEMISMLTWCARTACPGGPAADCWSSRCSHCPRRNRSRTVTTSHRATSAGQSWKPSPASSITLSFRSIPRHLISSHSCCANVSYLKWLALSHGEGES